MESSLKKRKLSPEEEKEKKEEKEQIVYMLKIQDKEKRMNMIN